MSATDVPQKRKVWVQDVQVAAQRQVYSLAKTGAFKGHASAQAVLQYYAFNIAIYDSAERGFRRGYVMPKCTYPAAVAKATSYTPKAVREANIWLHRVRLIAVEDEGASISFDMFRDDDSERERVRLLAEAGPREAPRLKVGPRSGADWKVPEIGPDAEVIEPEVRSIRTSGSIARGPNRTSGLTYSSDLPDYSDSDYTDSTSSVRREEFGEEGRTSRADVAGQPRADTRNRGKDRPVLPDDGCHWYVDPHSQNYRPAVGRGRPKRGEILFVGTEHDLKTTYGSHLTGPARQPADRGDETLISSWPADDVIGEELFPARNRPQRGGYDNTFHMGMTSAGEPYFTRASSRPRRKDEREVELTSDEAIKLMTLKGAGHLAHRRELHAKYRNQRSVA